MMKAIIILFPPLLGVALLRLFCPQMRIKPLLLPVIYAAFAAAVYPLAKYVTCRGIFGYLLQELSVKLFLCTCVTACLLSLAWGGIYGCIHPAHKDKGLGSRFVVLAAVIISSVVVEFTKYLIKLGTNLEVLLYTLTMGTGGTDIAVIWDGIKWCIPNVLVQLAVCGLICGAWHKCVLNLRLKRVLSVLLIIGLTLASLGYGWLYTNKKLYITQVIARRNENTQIYEEYFVDPAAVNVTAPETKRNLIFVWLESMETTFDPKYMPELTRIAAENTAFTGSKLGRSGIHAMSSNGYTFGAMFSLSSGTPITYINQRNETSDKTAENACFIWDILKRDGYFCECVMGSSGEFAGTANMLTGHGFEKIMDLDAMQGTYLPEGYKVGWGVEDYKLYEIAESEITAAYAQGEPFCVMISTIDTHFPGYSCARCPDTYPTQFENVLSCADTLAGEFVSWCTAQPFYENTTIVLVGDHPRMYDELLEQTEYYERTVYNAIINPAGEAPRTSDRVLTIMDFYPTTLAALGYEIEGDRLGFGTNLFTDRDSLCEEIGFDYLDQETSKRSVYYLEHF